MITFDFAAVMAADGAWRSNKPRVTWEAGRDGAAVVHLPNGSKWGTGLPWQLLEFPSLPRAFGAVSGAFGDDGSSTGIGHRLHSQPRLLAQTSASH